VENGPAKPWCILRGRFMRVEVSLAICFLAVTLLGCRERNSEQRLVDMAVKIENDSARMEELSLALDGISARLARIESSLDRKAGSPSGSETAEGSTDLESLSARVASLGKEVAAMKRSLASTRRLAERIGDETWLGKVSFWDYAARTPEEFAENLDRLLGDLSFLRGDPLLRQEFVSEVTELRKRVLAGFPTQELYEEARRRTVEELNLVTDEDRRKQLEQWLSRLDKLDEEPSLNMLQHLRFWRCINEIKRIAKTYSVPRGCLERAFKRPSEKE